MLRYTNLIILVFGNYQVSSASKDKLVAFVEMISSWRNWLLDRLVDATVCKDTLFAKPSKNSQVGIDRDLGHVGVTHFMTRDQVIKIN